MFSTLTLVTFAPLVGVAILLLLRDEQRDAIRWTALTTALITFAISLVLLLQFRAGEPGLQLVTRAPWIAAGVLRVDYFLAVDGISLWLVLLTTFLVPVAIGAAWGAITERVRAFMVWFLLLEVGMVGAFLAMDLLLFYIFFEFTLLPMIFLIGQWGGERRVYAALKFFLFTFAGSIFMLIAILYLGATAHTFSYPDLRNYVLADGVSPWLFAAFAIAFAIKVPVWPLHTWLPDAHVEAPTPGSVILAGVLLKLGTYGFLRFNLGLFPVVAAQAAPLFGVLGVIGILYGAITAFAQSDAKKLVAYSSVSHLGFVMLGLFALNDLGIQGAILQMVNHGLSTGALFVLVGYIYERRHTRELSQFGGLWKVMPVFAALSMVVFFSSAGLPGLNGFVGEFTILLGAWGSGLGGVIFSQALTAVAAVGVILAAVYMLWLYRRMFQGEVTVAANRGLADLSPREIAVLVPLLIFIVLIGVYPKPFFDLMAPSVQLLAQGLDAAAVALR
ncbi:MAG: NADH-quinone oxidoreductase subunit M [Anaerolineales bacterium]|nr:NADH-quinone oxidoreductase subunit M [Anaerolineales bacterium]